MFSHFKSNSLLKLAKILAKKSNELDGIDPFRKQWIIVQNKEMEQWLTLQVAEETGIAANFEFILPSELMWKLYRLIIQEVPKVLPSDRIPMQLQIFDLIESSELKMSLHSVLGEFSDSQKPNFQFANQVADVFDLYQVYRPNFLEAWEKGKLLTGDKSEIWQSRIWRKLVSEWNKDYLELPTRKQAFLDLNSALNSQESAFPKLPAQIYVFGLSSFSEPFMDLIVSLSRSIDVHFFDFEANKKSSYGLPEKEWNDIQTDWYTPRFESGALLINKIRAMDLAYHVESFDMEVVDVNTIGIHSCHNSKREVEVLKDTLLTKFDSDKLLKPEDVLLLVPDMEEYYPLIKSIFGFEGNEPVIPVYSNTQKINSVLLFFERLLELLSTKIKVSTFYNLLELEPVKERLGLNESDLKQIKGWLQKNKVHWGLNIDESDNSIEKGLINIWNGLSMELEPFESYKDFIPFEGVSSSDHFELSAKLSEIITFIKRNKKKSTGRKEVYEWLDLLESWIEFLKPESSLATSFTFTPIIPGIDKLKQSAKISKSTAKVEFEVFKKWVLDHITDAKASSSGFGRGVVVSTYIPYRNIPFKHTVLLGFNEHTFPRNPIRPGFDLINNRPKVGDRITKEDDKLLFLELLQSVSKHIHISYHGQDQYTDNERLPSVLVQRLIDLLESVSQTKAYFTSHKLHGFNKEYFHPAKCYSQKRRVLSEITSAKTQNQLPFFSGIEPFINSEEVNQVDLNDLISFFTHPCKFFCTKKLIIKDRFEERDLEDREVFKISGLDKFTLDQIVAEGINLEVAYSEIEEFTRKANLLPAGVGGSKAFNKQYDEIANLNEVKNRYITELQDEIQINIELDGQTITGKIADIYGNSRIKTRLGKLRAVDQISLWLNHLLLVENSNEFYESKQICKDKTGKVSVTTISDVSDHTETLRRLLKWYCSFANRKESLAFFPESSKAFCEALISKKEYSESLKKALTNWIGSDFSYISESSDYYNKLIWRGENPINTTSFSENANLFWEPLLKHSKTSVG